MYSTQYRSNKGVILLVVAVGMVVSMLLTYFVSAANSQSLTFTGQSDEYLYKASPSGLPTGSSARTIEAWVKTTSTSTFGILDYGNDAGGQSKEWNFYTDSNILSLSISGSQIRWSAPNLTDGNWHHVAVAYANGTNINSGLVAYMDGSALTKIHNGSGVPNTTNDELFIGATISGPTHASFFDGKIDDVRIWNTTRSSTDINNDMSTELVGNESGLVGYWKLNGNLNDSTTNANHVTLPRFTSDLPF